MLILKASTDFYLLLFVRKEMHMSRLSPGPTLREAWLTATVSKVTLHNNGSHTAHCHTAAGAGGSRACASLLEAPQVTQCCIYY